MRIELRPTLVVNSSPYLKEEKLIDLIWLVGLLKEIEQRGNLNGISRQSPSSYKSAWGKLTLAESHLSLELVIRRKGHGAKLSEFGLMLIEFVEGMRQRCLQENASYQDSLLNAIHRIHLVESSKWKFFSSSDDIMEQAVHQVKGFELKIVDSSEAIHKLLGGEADIAGYNTSNEQNSISVYRHLLKSNMEVFPVFRRTQGLLVKKCNPFGIQSIFDLTRNEIRFINRQKGSGTRILLDELLRKNGISPLQINGYLKEELKHSAVANAILANQADVGLGVENVALTSNLDFIPLVEEIFFIAMRKELISEPAIGGLIRMMRSKSQKTPGYDAIYLNREIERWTNPSPRKDKTRK